MYPSQALMLLVSMVGACAVFSQEPDKTAPNVVAVEPGVKVTLLAEHPDLATPTGIDLDPEGNLWVVACHTHFRPAGYQGPESDEILVFDPQGKNRRVYYNNTKTTMQLLAGPEGWLYIAQRDRILRIKDADNDGVGDTQELIARLDTEADYPHNGLSGMTWHNDGGLIFSLGENFGKDWALYDSDSNILRGRGEGGVFYCSKDGKGLRRIAKGFWNPFGLWKRGDGVLFAAENDPGSRPPCRLLHVVEGGDYGFQCTGSPFCLLEWGTAGNTWDDPFEWRRTLCGSGSWFGSDGSLLEQSLHRLLSIEMARCNAWGQADRTASG